jgi:hypothetical protein
MPNLYKIGNWEYENPNNATQQPVGPGQGQPRGPLLPIPTPNVVGTAMTRGERLAARKSRRNATPAQPLDDPDEAPDADSEQRLRGGEKRKKKGRKAQLADPADVLGELATAPSVSRVLASKAEWTDTELEKIKSALISDWTLLDDFENLRGDLIVAGIGPFENDEESEASRPKKKRKTRAAESNNQGSSSSEQRVQGQIRRSYTLGGLPSSFDNTDNNLQRLADQRSTNSGTPANNGFDLSEADTQLAQQVLRSHINRSVIQEALWRDPSLLLSRERLHILKRALHPNRVNDFAAFMVEYERLLAQRDLDNSDASAASQPDQNNDTAEQASGDTLDQAEAQISEVREQARLLEAECNQRVEQSEATLQAHRNEVRDLEQQAARLRTEIQNLQNQALHLRPQHGSYGTAPQSQLLAMALPQVYQHQPRYQQNNHMYLGAGRRDGSYATPGPYPTPALSYAQHAAQNPPDSHYGQGRMGYGTGTALYPLLANGYGPSTLPPIQPPAQPRPPVLNAEPQAEHVAGARDTGVHRDMINEEEPEPWNDFLQREVVQRPGQLEGHTGPPDWQNDGMFD